jgi:squalene-associated FAD-dependent desaturase
VADPSAATAKHVAVIGGGWAGCAAAVELARSGWRVSLLEAARTLGGRARRVEIDGKPLDNGQHILLGAYTESLRLMRQVGIDTDRALLRLPLQMRYPPGSGGMDFIAPRLPAPLHLLFALLTAKGLAYEDKLALARFTTAARWMGWRLNEDCTVLEMLERHDQTPRLYGLLWRPLCIAALNTPPERASAKVFMNVLRDSVGARRAASDMLIPKLDLSALFADRAAEFVIRQGGRLELGRFVRTLARAEAGWQVDDDIFDAVVVATPPAPAATLLDGIADTDLMTQFEYEPISSCYLQYPSETRLQNPFYALFDHPETGKWGQFVFDRGQLDPNQAGLLAVVVSVSGDAIALGKEALAATVAAQLAREFKRPELEEPISVQVISERRATLACTPNLMRPECNTGVDGLVIAGDYTASDYPATLESAVRSGINAARILNNLN